MAIYPIITVGETIVSKLKQYYFKDEAWTPSLSNKISDMLTCLKVLSRPFFPLKDEVGMLQELCNFSKQDMDDAFSGAGAHQRTKAIMEDRLCEVSGQPRSIGVHMKDFLEK